MQLTRSAIFFLALVALWPSAANAACGLSNEHEQVINAMLQAADTTAYSGTVLLEHSSERQFVSVSAAAEGGMGSLRRLTSRADAPIESFSAVGMRTADACELAMRYVFDIQQGQPVAGRSTLRLTIKPRDSLRFGYVIEMDESSALPLRVITVTPDGQVLERYEFADISIEGVSHWPAPQLVSLPGRFVMAALPPGFSVVARRMSSVETLIVSDGFAAASVFIEPAADDLMPGEGAVQHGSTVSYTRGISMRGQKVLVTVLGEIPLTTARLVADAVRPVAMPREVDVN